MATVLFVCTANRYRSPIAEACFRRELAAAGLTDKVAVSSAGTWTKAGLPVMPEALQDARRLGLDIQGHQSQQVNAGIIESASLVLVMEQGQKEALQNEFSRHREKIYLLSEVAKKIPYDIPDPVLDTTDGDVASEICDLIKKGFNRIVELSGK